MVRMLRTHNAEPGPRTEFTRCYCRRPAPTCLRRSASSWLSKRSNEKSTTAATTSSFLNEPSYAHQIGAALNEIGCPETARITEDALAILGLRPDWTDEQIADAAADMPDDQMAKLDPLDEEFFAYPDPIEDRLLAFIRANTAEIRL
jgi:hypothetical protein